MILGLGLDIVSTSRFITWLSKPQMAKRFFAKEELEYIYSKGKMAHLSFSSHFAAKEACGKALGVGLRGLCLKDIITLHKKGVPTLLLKGHAKAIFESLEASSLHLSLSHEKEYAVAVVIIEKL